MIFKEVPKFIINLERRVDRLDSIKKEMDYIGWDYSIFNAIDTNNEVGCALSHVEILKISKETKNKVLNAHPSERGNREILEIIHKKLFDKPPII